MWLVYILFTFLFPTCALILLTIPSWLGFIFVYTDSFVEIGSWPIIYGHRVSQFSCSLTIEPRYFQMFFQINHYHQSINYLKMGTGSILRNVPFLRSFYSTIQTIDMIFFVQIGLCSIFIYRTVSFHYLRFRSPGFI